MRRLHTLGLALCGAALSGCVTLNPKVDVVEPTQARPTPPTATATAPNGSIFQGAGYRPLYETHRARMVGDIITIVINEELKANQEKTTTIQKDGKVSSGITAVPLIGASSLAKLEAAGNSNNTYNGKGTAKADNKFEGNITATVIEVLPNGHLVVSAEKQIGIGANVDVLRFSGQIDPMAIQRDNSVSSQKVANVRVEQRGQGAQQEAQGIGWLSRIFLSISPF
ncbi:flagellar basal body L-ring protein FlgH [uncultured Aquabacterium sp.]|jgi:flagellar L-ring protein precursor FlgH|uniref:flagellar basal body L-ring protein FlgH n=1 Tax=uncultured Aquabacterium sp. TaxID=158753 RepID=UPI0026284F31|nr:flagellar basal body L-ring protein FlgH [uncultured Aquabacterium sp.]